VTLTLQNAGLAILMHYSRVSASPSRSYSAASAVLLSELLKGSISFAIALSNTPDPQFEFHDKPREFSLWHEPLALQTYLESLNRRSRVLWREIFSSDCWKLSIPAILYVIQVRNYLIHIITLY
jgi:UDP-sugar transporter A1/2/3